MKKQTIKIFSTVLVLFFMLAGQAQKTKVSGSIKDSVTRQSLSNATVYFTNTKTADTLKTISDAQGNFQLTNIVTGNYQLKVEYIGYAVFQGNEVTVSNDQQTVVLDDIYLSASKELMTGITVASKKTFIVQSANKITLNVTESPIASTSNAYDILLQAPGVMVLDNNIKFRAKSVAILIDGKPSNLNDEDLKSMLTALPGNTIEKVEIIPNPSAKYAAQGGSVINIKLVKNKNYGTSGTLLGGVGAGRYGRYNAGIIANYRSKKINVYSNYNYDYGQPYYHNTSDRTISTASHILQDEYGIAQKNNYTYRVGLDYDVSKKASIGLQVKGNSNLQNRNITNNSLLTNAFTTRDTSSEVNTHGNSKIFNPSINLYGKIVLDSLGKELLINADYFSYHKDWQDDYMINYFDDKQQQYTQPNFLRDNSPATNTIKSITIDYSYPSTIGNFEAGIKTALTVTDNNILWEGMAGNNWITDLSKTNHFIYRENINAAYVTYDKAFGQTWQLSMGLRAEQTIAKGLLVNEGKATTKSYVNLFPSVSIQYLNTIDNILNLSYRKSIDRFGLDIVNPFIKYQSQFSYYQGNPNIQPQINHSLDLTYTYKRTLTLGASETHSTNVLGPVYLPSTNNATISSYANFKSSDYFYVYGFLSREFIKGLTTNIIGGTGFYKYNTSDDVAIQQTNNSTWSYLLQFNNYLNLKSEWTAELNTAYQGPLASGIYQLNSIFSSSLGISRKLMKNRASVKFSLSDIFNTQQNKIHINYRGVVMYQERKVESQVASINFTYRLGNKNVKAKKERNSKINDLENRMNN